MRKGFASLALVAQEVLKRDLRIPIDPAGHSDLKPVTVRT
jgi:hypothetical protein